MLLFLSSWCWNGSQQNWFIIVNFSKYWFWWWRQSYLSLFSILPAQFLTLLTHSLVLIRPTTRMKCFVALRILKLANWAELQSSHSLVDILSIVKRLFIKIYIIVIIKRSIYVYTFIIIKLISYTIAFQLHSNNSIVLVYV